MTTYAKESLKTFFETGDVPTGQNYADFIDSCLNVVDTTAQSLNSPLSVTELIAPTVSAANGVFTGTVSAKTTYIDDLIASAARAAKFDCTGNISTSGATVYASAVRTAFGIFQGRGIVSAAGTAQATGALLQYVINKGAGVVDGQTTGFRLANNQAGLVQYIQNGGASANLWPASECVINVLATNAAFPMVANTLYTIVHVAASSYAVK